MISQPCADGERAPDLVQSYAIHQMCSGFVFGPEGPEPCSCVHHATPQIGRRRRWRPTVSQWTLNWIVVVVVIAGLLYFQPSPHACMILAAICAIMAIRQRVR